METGRVLLVQEAVRTLGFMSEVAAIISESEAFVHLRAPIKRLAGLDIPIPYAPQLERASVPQTDDIVKAALQMVKEW
jgi:pyruvate dehydrogenase E1 component beta subunit